MSNDQFEISTHNLNALFRRLKQFITLNDIAQELLATSIVTDPCYELMCVLCAPNLPENKSIEELESIIKQHLGPKRSDIAERHVFRQRKQGESESVNEYLQSLKHLAKTCNFGYTLEINLRDQFVSGLRNDSIRSRLFAEQELDFKQAVKLALELEEAPDAGSTPAHGQARAAGGGSEDAAAAPAPSGARSTLDNTLAGCRSQVTRSRNVSGAHPSRPPDDDSVDDDDGDNTMDVSGGDEGLGAVTSTTAHASHVETAAAVQRDALAHTAAVSAAAQVAAAHSMREASVPVITHNAIAQEMQAVAAATNQHATVHAAQVVAAATAAQERAAHATASTFATITDLMTTHARSIGVIFADMLRAISGDENEHRTAVTTDTQDTAGPLTHVVAATADTRDTAAPLTHVVAATADTRDTAAQLTHVVAPISDAQDPAAQRRLVAASADPQDTAAQKRVVAATADPQDTAAQKRVVAATADTRDTAAPLTHVVAATADTQDTAAPLTHVVAATADTRDTAAPLTHVVAATADTRDTAVPLTHVVAATADTPDMAAPLMHVVAATADTRDTAAQKRVVAAIADAQDTAAQKRVVAATADTQDTAAQLTHVVTPISDAQDPAAQRRLVAATADPQVTAAQKRVVAAIADAQDTAAQKRVVAATADPQDTAAQKRVMAATADSQDTAASQTHVVAATADTQDTAAPLTHVVAATSDTQDTAAPLTHVVAATADTQDTAAPLTHVVAATADTQDTAAPLTHVVAATADTQDTAAPLTHVVAATADTQDTAAPLTHVVAATADTQDTAAPLTHVVAATADTQDTAAPLTHVVALNSHTPTGTKRKATYSTEKLATQEKFKSKRQTYYDDENNSSTPCDDDDADSVNNVEEEKLLFNMDTTQQHQSQEKEKKRKANRRRSRLPGEGITVAAVSYGAQDTTAVAASSSEQDMYSTVKYSGRQRQIERLIHLSTVTSPVVYSTDAVAVSFDTQGTDAFVDSSSGAQSKDAGEASSSAQNTYSADMSSGEQSMDSAAVSANVQGMDAAAPSSGTQGSAAAVVSRDAQRKTAQSIHLLAMTSAFCEAQDTIEVATSSGAQDTGALDASPGAQDTEAVDALFDSQETEAGDASPGATDTEAVDASPGAQDTEAVDALFDSQETEAGDASPGAPDTEAVDASPGAQDTEAVDASPGAQDTEAVDASPGAQDTEAVDASPGAQDTEAVDASPGAQDTEAVDASPGAQDTEAVDASPGAQDTEAVDASPGAPETEAGVAPPGAQDTEVVDALFDSQKTEAGDASPGAPDTEAGDALFDSQETEAGDASPGAPDTEAGGALFDSQETETGDASPGAPDTDVVTALPSARSKTARCRMTSHAHTSEPKRSTYDDTYPTIELISDDSDVDGDEASNIKGHADRSPASHRSSQHSRGSSSDEERRSARSVSGSDSDDASHRSSRHSRGRSSGEERRSARSDSRSDSDSDRSPASHRSRKHTRGSLSDEERRSARSDSRSDSGSASSRSSRHTRRSSSGDERRSVRSNSRSDSDGGGAKIVAAMASVMADAISAAQDTEAVAANSGVQETEWAVESDAQRKTKPSSPSLDRAVASAAQDTNAAAAPSDDQDKTARPRHLSYKALLASDSQGTDEKATSGDAQSKTARLSYSLDKTSVSPSAQRKAVLSAVSSDTTPTSFNEKRKTSSGPLNTDVVTALPSARSKTARCRMTSHAHTSKPKRTTYDDAYPTIELTSDDSDVDVDEASNIKGHTDRSPASHRSSQHSRGSSSDEERRSARSDSRSDSGGGSHRSSRHSRGRSSGEERRSARSVSRSDGDRSPASHRSSKHTRGSSSDEERRSARSVSRSESGSASSRSSRHTRRSSCGDERRSARSKSRSDSDGDRSPASHCSSKHTRGSSSDGERRSARSDSRSDSDGDRSPASHRSSQRRRRRKRTRLSLFGSSDEERRSARSDSRSNSDDDRSQANHRSKSKRTRPSLFSSSDEERRSARSNSGSDSDDSRREAVAAGAGKAPVLKNTTTATPSTISAGVIAGTARTNSASVIAGTASTNSASVIAGTAGTNNASVIAGTASTNSASVIAGTAGTNNASVIAGTASTNSASVIAGTAGTNNASVIAETASANGASAVTGTAAAGTKRKAGHITDTPVAPLRFKIKRPTCRDMKTQFGQSDESDDDIKDKEDPDNMDVTAPSGHASGESLFTGFEPFFDRRKGGSMGDIDLPGAHSHAGRARFKEGSEADPAQVDDEEIGVGETFVDYMPSKFNQGLEHPDPVVESASLASVEPVDVTYTLSLPSDIIRNGLLSALQLEAVVYASQAHEHLLPDNTRAGFLIGDGTGMGKGRTIAGIIFENYIKGRKRAIWVSVSNDLKYDAERDLRDIGAGNIEVHGLDKMRYGETSSAEEGVMFCTYSALIGKTRKNECTITRLNQLQEWFGRDFDGVIVFDECHKAKNLYTAGNQSSIAVFELQQQLHMARVVYVSATAAGGPRNMAYMVRLGIWGDGTPFKSFNDFIGVVEKRGVSAMEIIAMDMKLRGVYVARQLSFRGVSFTIEEVPLSDEFKEIYDESVKLWVLTKQRFTEAAMLLNVEPSRKKTIWGQFWSAHHRFFKYLCVAAKVKHALVRAREALKCGKCVVIGLQSTGEAGTLDQLERDDGETTDFVSTVRGVFQNLVEKYFPLYDGVPCEAHTSRRKSTDARRGIDSDIDDENEADTSRRKSNARLRIESDVDDETEADTPRRKKSEASASRRKFAAARPMMEISSDDDDGMNKHEERRSPGSSSRTDSDAASHRSIQHTRGNASDEERRPDSGSDRDVGYTQNKKPSRTAIMQAQDKKDELLAAIENLGRRLPPNTLDQLVDELGGTAKVAEITGRKIRMVQTKDGQVQCESRSRADVPHVKLNVTEKQRFMDGHKSVAIISAAASSGISLQSDRRVANTSRRVHITLELSYSAEIAVQQFGRTHRSNQENAPEYIYLISDLAGERRFASIVAKRLQALGALTHGDRRAKDTWDLGQFYIDGNYGGAAVKTVMDVLTKNECPLVPPPSGYPGNFFQDMAKALEGVGLIINGVVAPLLEKDYNNMSRFLNRILGMPVELQNRLFKYFTDTLDAKIDKAKRDGSFDLGIQDLSARVRRRAVRRYWRRHATGRAPVLLHTLLCKSGMDWPEALEKCSKLSGTYEGFYVSKQSCNEFDTFTAVLCEYADSSRRNMLLTYSPNTGLEPSPKSLVQIEKKYRKVESAEAESWWRAQYNASLDVCCHTYLDGFCRDAPDCEQGMRVRTRYVLSGLVLAVWARVKDVLDAHDRRSKLQVVRIKTDDGLKIIGTLIPKNCVEPLKEALSSDAESVSEDEFE